MSAAVTIYEAVALAAIPEIPGIVAAILAAIKKHPDVTPEQIVAIVADQTTRADALYQQTLDLIAADQSAHPEVPNVVK